MESQDRRIKRTQALLAQALIALTLEKGYEAVTIRDITERANIGYATFFRHFHDKDALLRDVLDVVFDELVHLVQPPSHAGDPVAAGTLLFQYVGEHSALCRVLLSSRGATQLVQRTIALGSQNVLEQYAPAPTSTIPPEIAAYHFVAATIALIQWWLDHAMPYPPARMGTIFRDLIVAPTRAVAFQE